MDKDYDEFVQRMGSFEMDLDFDEKLDPRNKKKPKNQNELTHYGIKGMKWGVRRTPEQLGRSQERKRIRAEDKAIKKERKKTSKNRRLLSDEDLQLAVGRLQTEKKLKDLTEQDLAVGQSQASKTLIQIGRSTLTTAGTAVATYAVKAVLEKKFDRKEAAKFIKPKK